MNRYGSATQLSRQFDKLSFIYGTAWKKDGTTRLVKEALSKGFRAIDTACQPRHYREELVGTAIREFFKETHLAREEIWLQTKFTSPAGQDPNNTPYDRAAELETQIHSSISTSFSNLRPNDEESSAESGYLDCVLLHSPLKTLDATIQAYRILESYVPSKIRTLGISNVALPVLSALYDAAKVKPHVVQNRFYPDTSYDVTLREYCRQKGIVYQSFWTLTGNPQLLKSESVKTLAEAVGITPQVALYALVVALDVVVLNGTTGMERMTEDLDGMDKVRLWSESHPDKSAQILSEFKELIGEKSAGYGS